MPNQAEVQEVARHVLWHVGDRVNGIQPGGFTTSLLETWGRADGQNRARLSTGFPVYAHALGILETLGTAGLLSWAKIERRTP